MIVDFIYTVDPAAEEPIMLIDKHIGFDEEMGMGVDGSQFARELYALDAMGKRRIQINICSPGGVILDGYNICMAMRQTKCKIDTFNGGLAASTAGWIFLCGREREMADYAIFMAHEPHGGNDVEYLSYLTNSIATLIASRCNKTKDEVLAIMAKTTFMDASECIDAGICTDVKISTDANVGRLSKKLADKNEIISFWKQTATIMNNALKLTENNISTNTNMAQLDYSKICNKLKLVSHANDEAIIDAINSLETKSKLDVEAANKMSDEFKKKLEEKENELNAIKSKYDAAQCEFVKLQNSVKDEKEKAEKEQKEKDEKDALNTVDAMAKDGLIKADPEVVNKWKDEAKANPKRVIDIMNTIRETSPVNKTAPNINGLLKDDKAAGDKSKDFDGKTPEEREMNQANYLKDAFAKAQDAIKKNIKEGKVDLTAPTLK